MWLKALYCAIIGPRALALSRHGGSALNLSMRFGSLAKLFSLRSAGGFLVAGLLALAADLGSFSFLRVIGVPLLVANVLSALLAMAVNYTINHLAFLGASGTQINQRSIVRFVLVAGISFLYVVLSFQLVVSIGGLNGGAPELMARAVVIGSGTVVRYFLYRLWVFSK